MSGYILCQVKRTENPYYIESISMNVYSIEELCYFISNNLYLLDESILNEELCKWLGDELGLWKLSGRLHNLIQNKYTIGEFIFPILKEINYLSLEGFQALQKQLNSLDEEHIVIRMKKKGDCLLEYGKLVGAIGMYHKTIAQAKTADYGQQFCGKLWHNIGCAYMRLFQSEEALESFEKAYECLKSRVTLKNYLLTFYICREKSEFEEERKRLEADDNLRQEIIDEISKAELEKQESKMGVLYREASAYKNEGDIKKYREEMDKIFEDLTKEYHRNTGL